MTESQRKESYDAGWDGYFAGKTQQDCPSYPEQDMRDEWNIGWLSAQSWELQDPHEHLGWVPLDNP
jgi:ribosome modulation factor